MVSTTAIFHGHAGHPSILESAQHPTSAHQAAAGESNSEQTGADKGQNQDRNGKKWKRDPAKVLEATRLRLGGFTVREGSDMGSRAETPLTESREDSIKRARGVGALVEGEGGMTDTAGHIRPERN